MSTSFDILASAISEIRSTDVTSREYYANIARRPEFYALRFGADKSDVAGATSDSFLYGWLTAQLAGSYRGLGAVPPA